MGVSRSADSPSHSGNERANIHSQQVFARCAQVANRCVNWPVQYCRPAWWSAIASGTKNEQQPVSAPCDGAPQLAAAEAVDAGSASRTRQLCFAGFPAQSARTIRAQMTLRKLLSLGRQSRDGCCWRDRSLRARTSRPFQSRPSPACSDPAGSAQEIVIQAQAQRVGCAARCQHQFRSSGSSTACSASRLLGSSSTRDFARMADLVPLLAMCRHGSGTLPSPLIPAVPSAGRSVHHRRRDARHHTRITEDSAGPPVSPRGRKRSGLQAFSRSPFIALAVTATMGRVLNLLRERIARIVSYPSMPSGIMMSMKMMVYIVGLLPAASGQSWGTVRSMHHLNSVDAEGALVSAKIFRMSSSTTSTFLPTSAGSTGSRLCQLLPLQIVQIALMPMPENDRLIEQPRNRVSRTDGAG